MDSIETRGDGTGLLFPYICAGCRALLQENCGMCPHCFRSGLIFPRYRRVVDEYLPPLPPASVTAAELTRSNIPKTFEISPCPGLKLGYGGLVLLHGEPGSGKTTLALKMADALKPSAVVPLEMGVGELLKGMLQRLEIISKDISFYETHKLPDLLSLAALPSLRSLVIDSLTVAGLSPDDARTLARANGIVVLGVLQETKAGVFRGSNEFAHAADVILEVRSMTWRLTKSRFQQAIGVEGRICDLGISTPAFSA